MRPGELIGLIRVRPFTGLRIHATGGNACEIRHPDQIIVPRRRVDIGVGMEPDAGAAERVEQVSLLHAVRVEDLAAASTQDSA